METSDEILESVDFVCFDFAELVSDVGFMGLTLLVGFFQVSVPAIVLDVL